MIKNTIQNMVELLIKYKIPRKNETLKNVSDWLDYYINVEHEEFLICLDCEDYLESCCCDCAWGGGNPDND